jgi:D-beta-D-heptose 7-phosphate kinase/D-beta-D-heptose 1-phosphate adenosyltransferase
VGDSCIDVYQYGTTTKLSPEAPVPIFVKDSEEVKDGMALNVKNNLEALGCNVHLITGNNKSIKTRVIDTKSNQHLLRIDDDKISDPITHIPGYYYDAIVFSDYDKGSCTYDLIQDTMRRFKGPVFVDTKKTDIGRFNYDNAIVKINSKEYLSSVGSINVNNLIVTYGKEGAVWNGNHYSAPKVEVSDVCGAGDTFLAALVYGFLETKEFKKAIPYAIKAAAITVQHIGVYAPKLEEI